MKKTIKTFIMMLMICAMVCNVSITNVHASGAGGLAVSQSTVQRGQIFTVNFNIPAIDKKLTNLQLDITFDNNAFEQVGINVPTLVGASTQGGSVTGNVFNFTAFEMNGDNTIDLSAGATFSLTLKAKESAAITNYSFKVENYIMEYIPDGTWQPVSCVLAGFTSDVSVSVVPVPVYVQGVSLNVSELTLKAGETSTLVATVNPSNADNLKVTYTSSNPAVATVDATTGVVTAVAEGVAIITVTTADGGKTATCTVTVPHQHTLQPISASQSSCTVQGNNAYYQCSGCKQYFKDAAAAFPTTVEGEKLPMGNHVCDTHVKANDATHEKEGNIEHWICSVCKQYFKDAAGTQVITKEQTVIGVIEHTFAPKSDNTNHWQECSCGETKGVTKHSYSVKSDDTNHWKECACGNKIEVAKHSYNPKSDDTNHWKECACGSKIEVTKHNYRKESNDTNHWKECSCGKTKDIAEHSYEYKFDTNNHWKECSCGKTKDTENHSHTQKTDNKYHWKECVCGNKYEIGGHTFQWIIDKAATETETGLQHEECTFCKYKQNEGTVVNKLEHKHVMTKQEGTAATCTTDGVKEHYKCTSCGKLYEDANGTKELSSIVIEATGHVDTIMKSDETEHWEVCSCGVEVSRDAHSDSDENGICDVCEFELVKETESTEEETTEESSEVITEEETSTESTSTEESSSEESSEKEETSTEDSEPSENDGKNKFFVLGAVLIAGVGGLIIFILKKLLK